MLYRSVPPPRWEIASESITFLDYPFYPSSVYPSRQLTAADIVDVNLSFAPPTVRIGHELLMVSAEQRHELRHFAEANGIARSRRPDIWADILEPALDTEFSHDHRRHTMERLVTHGLDRSEVHDLRARFVPPLLLYNFAVPLWEWVHLGLFDLLEAVHPLCAYPDDAGTRRLRHGLEIPDPPFTTDDEYPRIYWEAMRIALLADT